MLWQRVRDTVVITVQFSSFHSHVRSSFMPKKKITSYITICWIKPSLSDVNVRTAHTYDIELLNVG